MADQSSASAQPPVGKAVRGNQKKIHGHCSWCFQECTQSRVKRGMLAARDRYQCEGCLQRTLPCRAPGCHDMARGTPGFDEEFCWVHRKKISSWEKGEEESSKEGYCSWCLEKTVHRQMMNNPATILGNAVRECTCGRITRKCSECKTAFARDVGMGTKKCLVCLKWINNWDDPETNRRLLTIEKWCSWCFNRGDFFKLSDSKWQCTTCELHCVDCESCEEGMARGNLFSKKCANCSSKKDENTWEKLNEKKEFYFSKVNTEDYIRTTCQTMSPQRAKAQDAGMLRPFVLLLTMHPAVRHMVGSMLGMTLLTSKRYGDPHREASKLIFRDKTGLLARSNEFYESLNAAARNCNWYEVLYRMVRASVKKTKFKKLTFSESIKECRDATNPLLPSFEMEILEGLAVIQDKKLERDRPELRALAENAMTAPEVRELAANLKKAGLYSDTLLRFVCQTCVGMHDQEDDLHLADWGKELKAQVLKGSGYYQKAKTASNVGRKAAGVGGKVVFNQVVLMAINPILGFAFLAFNIGTAVANAAAGSDHASLFNPICLILIQRLLLALQGVNTVQVLTTSAVVPA